MKLARNRKAEMRGNNKQEPSAVRTGTRGTEIDTPHHPQRCYGKNLYRAHIQWKVYNAAVEVASGRTPDNPTVLVVIVQAGSFKHRSSRTTGSPSLTICYTKPAPGAWLICFRLRTTKAAFKDAGFTFKCYLKCLE